MLNIKDFDKSLISSIIIIGLGLMYTFGFVFCQARYIKDFGFLPFPHEYYLCVGFIFLIVFLMYSHFVFSITKLLFKFLEKAKPFITLIIFVVGQIITILPFVFFVIAFSKSQNYLIAIITGALSLIFISFNIVYYYYGFGYCRTLDMVDKSLSCLVFLTMYLIVFIFMIFTISFSGKHDSPEHIINLNHISTQDINNNSNDNMYLVDLVFIGEEYVYAYKIESDSNKTPIVFNRRVIENIKLKN